MVEPRPLLWHFMQYHAYHGHKEFILCLGYGAEKIKDYFLNYSETLPNDFVLHGGKVELMAPTSPTGPSRSPTPASSRRSASGCGGCANTSGRSPISWPTTPTC